MKTKLDKNGYTVYTVPTKEDCIIALNNLKDETLKNKYMADFVLQVEKAIELVENNQFNELLKYQYKNVKYKPLQRIIYIFEKEYLHELWTTKI